MSVSVLHVPQAYLYNVIPQADVTVEAEYGDVVLEGRLYTAAHHQASGQYVGRHKAEGGRPAPCNDPNIPELQDGSVAVSHVDLDTVGGCMRALGYAYWFEPEFASFWEAAEHVDVRGPHRLPADHPERRRLQAVWAYFGSARKQYPRDQVVDITADIHAAAEAIGGILSGEEAYLRAGDEFAAAESALNRKSLRGSVGPVARAIVVRESDQFTNHLYNIEGGLVGVAVVAHNTKMGSITVSLADPIPGVSCRQVVQELWGPEAGGHDGIAGSPRGKMMTRKDCGDAVKALAEALGIERVEE